MSGAYTLLVDNSNTRTKFALAAGGQLLPERRVLPTAGLTPMALQQLLHGWEYSRAAICSVVPHAAEILRSALGCPTQLLTADTCPDLLRGYPAPHTLGADRIANAAAAACCYPLPCIAVDMGTAVTCDLIVAEDGRPRFLGGVIAPGAPTLAAALAGSTALLPPTDSACLRSDPPPAVGNSTAAALRAGLYYGYPAMVQGILRALTAELPQAPCVVLTGGDAALIPPSDSTRHIIDNDLTFKGILSLFPDH